MSRLFYLIIYSLSLSFFLHVMAPLKVEGTEWIMIIDNEEGTYYIDSETLKKTPTTTEVRELKINKNHKEINRILTHAVYDCINGKKQIFLTFTSYKNRETSLISSKNPEWIDAANDSGTKALLQYICK